MKSWSVISLECFDCCHECQYILWTDRPKHGIRCELFPFVLNVSFSPEVTKILQLQRRLQIYSFIVDSWTGFIAFNTSPAKEEKYRKVGKYANAIIIFHFFQSHFQTRSWKMVFKAAAFKTALALTNSLMYIFRWRTKMLPSLSCLKQRRIASCSKAGWQREACQMPLNYKYPCRTQLERPMLLNAFELWNARTAHNVCRISYYNHSYRVCIDVLWILYSCV